MTNFPDFSFANAELTIAASVTTGLEETAAGEIREKLDFHDSDFIKISRGRVYVKSHKKQLRFVHQLRSVDNLFLIIKTIDEYDYENSKEKVEFDLKRLASALPWFEVVQFWQFNSEFWKKESIQTGIGDRSEYNSTDAVSTIEEKKEVLQMTQDNSNENNNESLSCHSIPTTLSDGTLIKFRVSTNRVGKWQPVTSPEASRHFGGEIQEVTKWKVDLSNYNLEILLSLGEKSLEIALSLTFQSLHRRNITHFGFTTLRPTTAYCMLRMCEIQPGDLVVDPMCGTGAISVEGVLEWPNSFQIAGDIAKSAVSKCHSNFQELNNIIDLRLDSFVHRDTSKILPADAVRWDVTCLPVKTNVVDVVVSDLPFGKRVGSKADNRKLYPAALMEMARVTKNKSGRACLLTQDKRSMKRAVDSMFKMWQIKTITHINIGGLIAGIFLLQRTAKVFETTESLTV